jgi:hypothetical protein
MVQNGEKWYTIVQNGAKWCKCYKIVQNGAKWCKMLQKAVLKKVISIDMNNFLILFLKVSNFCFYVIDNITIFVSCVHSERMKAFQIHTHFLF